jgi:hypothetical protein
VSLTADRISGPFTFSVVVMLQMTIPEEKINFKRYTTNLKYQKDNLGQETYIRV